MDITMTPQTRMTGIAGSSSVCMSARGHVFADLSSVVEFGGLVVADRGQAKGQLAIEPAYTRGTPAWRPPLS